MASLSLQPFTAKQVMKRYQTRMQIEEGFRDTQNHPYDLGVAGKNQPIAKQVRVNSSSKRDPYSVIFLARWLLQQPTFRIRQEQIWQSLATVKPYIDSVLCP